jgi:hypothetical protein
VTRRHAIVVAAVLAASIVPVSSAGGAGVAFPDDQSSAQVLSGAGTPISLTQIPVRFDGQLTVQFHGDQATGCAARGLCGFSGTVIWQPPPTGSLTTDTFRRHGKIQYDAFLELLGQNRPAAPPLGGGITTADVRFQPSGSGGPGSTCTDAAATGGNIQLHVHLRAASLTLADAAPALLGTRCAGPVIGDVAHMLAIRLIDVASLSHGRTTVSLASSGAFAGHGLAGTVTSTVGLTLGRPHRQRVDSGAPSGQGGFRIVEVRYRARLTGQLIIDAHGDAASCASLGSCGAHGAFAYHMKTITGTLAVVAFARVRRPVRDVLAALGLRKGGNPSGIPVFGVLLARGAGTHTVAVTQGSNRCTDAAPVGPGAITLLVAPRRIAASYVAAEPTLHLRCPGPTVAAGTPLALGGAGTSVLGPRGGTIRLTTGIKLSDDGYTARTVADLALTIAHPKVRIVTDALSSAGRG